MENKQAKQNVKADYVKILWKAKLASLVMILLSFPRLILGFTDLDAFLGMSYETALLPMILGFVAYIIFAKKVWRCPACNQFPGGGWTRVECKECKVALK
ncbi:hypothetical protein [Ferrimonas futtsuensis]|uniref:hypothetical protein n=1 Tax=Ferrimonas futtsuensis TaxID=364764 RepID=UPI000480868B|nr:hypothetical protein [Ferrimonas futtsuensis]